MTDADWSAWSDRIRQLMATNRDEATVEALRMAGCILDHECSSHAIQVCRSIMDELLLSFSDWLDDDE